LAVLKPSALTFINVQTSVCAQLAIDHHGDIKAAVMRLES